MPTKHNNISLKECRPCVVLMQDTFAGVLDTDKHPNNCRMKIETPLKYFKALEKALNDKLHQRGVKSAYTTIIKVNPKDNRSFQSASFRYGRRLLTYTNVSSIANERTKEKTTFCIRQTTKTATLTFKVAGKGDKWTQQHEAAWKKQGYKGGFFSYDRPYGPIFTGNFIDTKGDKKIRVTSQRKSSRVIVFTIVQTVTFDENIYDKNKPQIWIRDTDRQMREDKFKGKIHTHVNSFDKLIIDGTYTKTEKINNGKIDYTIRFFNQLEKLSSQPIEDTDSWRPVKHLGKNLVQVRSIAQDDNYTPEFRGKKINWERIDIEKLYREYLQMPENEVETANKRLEAMNERAATKGQKAALKWLRSIKKTKPQWLQAPNAYSLALYCIKYIERESMTPSEATNFCKNNAYKK